VKEELLNGSPTTRPYEGPVPAILGSSSLGIFPQIFLRLQPLESGYLTIQEELVATSRGLKVIVTVSE
jgi:hypothetical protein